MTDKPETHLIALSAHHAARSNPATVVARDEDMSVFASVTRIWERTLDEFPSGGTGTGCTSYAATISLEQDGTFSIKLHGDTMLAQAGSDMDDLEVKLLITGSLKTCEVEVHDNP